MAKKPPPEPDKPKKKESWVDKWNRKVDDWDAEAEAREARKRGQGKNWRPVTEQEKKDALKQMKKRADHQMYSLNDRGVPHSYVDCFCGLSADHARPGE